MNESGQTQSAILRYKRIGLYSNINLRIMSRFIPFILFLQFFSYQSLGQPFTEHYLNNQTLTYSQLINSYKQLDARSDQMKLLSYGWSDGGFPIHMMVINRNKNFNKPSLNRKKEIVVLIMNGIHPGESEGIDASLLMIQQMAAGKIEIPSNITICMIPVYNVDGMLNRKRFTRTNQNGPEEKGFRGTACNYDLNRDFIKADSRNTFAFYRIFQEWDPDVFIDTHTSNGADYQYIMTLISTQKEKLGGKTAEFLYQTMNPYLYSEMAKKNFEMVPYVNVWGKAPDEEGYEVFIETPKFSTGFTALFGTLSFVAETHMLKPYPQRVIATYELLNTILNFSKAHGSEIRNARLIDTENFKRSHTYESNYFVIRENPEKLPFKGFNAEKLKSILGNYERTYYNREKPFTKEINYYNSCKPAFVVSLPRAYIVPHCWQKVIERLKANHIKLKQFEQDTLMDLSYYSITKFESSARPYEGHHVNNKIEVEKRKTNIKIQKGDYLIYTNQTGNRYLAEVLEPQTEDGFFAWNFFDPILNQKEGFSDYVFEDDALKLLESDSVLKSKFESWKLANPEKLNNSHEVLNFIFTHSPFFETEYRRYPVYRLE